MTNWTPVLSTVFDRFGADPHRIVHWMGSAHPRDFAALAAIVVKHAQSGDSEAIDLMQRTARHIDVIAARLVHLGVPRLSIMGGLADKLSPFLATETLAAVVEPVGDALSGALHLARAEAIRLTLHSERTTDHG
jgi:glucosamine kinase